jgi:hypothetical protein
MMSQCRQVRVQCSGLSLFSYKISVIKLLSDRPAYSHDRSRRPSFADVRIAVLVIRGKIIMVIFVLRGVGPSLFRGRSCAGARSNTQQPASARRYRATPSVLRYTIAIFKTDCCPCVRSPWQLSARNADVITINTYTNVFMFINH